MNCSVQETVSKKKETINEKLYDRNLPSQYLQPYLDVRPAMTKYSHFPIVDPRKQVNVSMNKMPTYNTQSTFNPGTKMAPWSGFASNVNTESILRNQIYALQKCSQAVYMPSSNSDLYKYTYNTNNSQEYHSLLFRTEKFDKFNPNPDTKVIGISPFMNSTRNQLHDIKSP